jgi:hypothetical protein
MEKIDFKKKLGPLYHPSAREVTGVDVPALNYLMIDGQGDPNTAQSYRDAVGALFSVSYAIKFTVKKGTWAIDYGVMPLEGLWWVDDMTQFTIEDKASWKWTAMIMQPDFVSSDLFLAAREQVEQKKNIAALQELRLEQFNEGTAAQILHIGPYAAEAPTIAKLHAFIHDQGGRRIGKHHEIYLSDPGRTAPEKLRTIIRQPFVS